MEYTIDIDIQDAYDLVEDYDKTKVCRKLIEYIIEEARHADKKAKLKIMIDKKNNFDHDATKLVRDGLEREYKKAKKFHQQENEKQFFEVLVGMGLLYFSTIARVEIIKELLLVGGWVPLWEAIELELFSEAKEKADIALLKRLKECEIDEKN